jgi:hypothetical protein
MISNFSINIAFGGNAYIQWISRDEGLSSMLYSHVTLSFFQRMVHAQNRTAIVRGE